MRPSERNGTDEEGSDRPVPAHSRYPRTNHPDTFHSDGHISFRRTVITGLRTNGRKDGRISYTEKCEDKEDNEDIEDM